MKYAIAVGMLLSAFHIFAFDIFQSTPSTLLPKKKVVKKMQPPQEIVFVSEQDILLSDLLYSVGIEYSQDNIDLFYQRNPHLKGISQLDARTKVNFPFTPGKKLFWNYDLIKRVDGTSQLILRRVFKGPLVIKRTVIQQQQYVADQQQNETVKKRFKKSDLFIGASMRYGLITLTDVTSSEQFEVSSRMNWSVDAHYTFLSFSRFTLTGFGQMTKYSFFPAQYKDSIELAFQTFDFGLSLRYYLTHSFHLFTKLSYSNHYLLEQNSSNALTFSTLSTIDPSVGISYCYDHKAHFFQLSLMLTQIAAMTGEYTQAQSSMKTSMEIDYRANVESEWKPNFKLGLDFHKLDTTQYSQSISEIHLGLYFVSSF